MANSPDFVVHAQDLLSLVGPVQGRAMFGGHSLYAGGVMFALLDDDELFLKTDELSRPRFVEESCRPWVYAGKESTSYFRPPDAAHEDAEAMLPWARLALDAALRLQAAKGAKTRRGPNPKALAKAKVRPPSRARRGSRRRSR